VYRGAVSDSRASPLSETALLAELSDDVKGPLLLARDAMLRARVDDAGLDEALSRWFGGSVGFVSRNARTALGDVMKAAGVIGAPEISFVNGEAWEVFR
jgi:hypothetical protein